MKANNILQFSASNNEKLEPIIDSDYFGSEKFDLLGLLETIEKLNIKQGKKMGYGVHSNSYQGDYKRVLTVCSANMLRSPTMAHVLASTPYDYNTRSAGTHSFALIPVTEELLFWADEIVCADTEHAKIVSEKLMSLNLDKPVVNLRIPDNYEYRDAGLILMIRRRYDEIMLSTK